MIITRITTLLLTAILLFTLTISLSAQSLPTPVEMSFFQDVTNKQKANKHSAFITNQKYLDISADAIQTIQRSKPSALTMRLPATLGLGDLELIRTNVFAGGYKLNTPDGHPQASNNRYAFYQGKIKGQEKSIAAVTFVNDEVKIMASNKGGNFRIHQLQKNEPYVFFRDRDLKEIKPFECGTADEGVQGFDPSSVVKQKTSMVGNCIEVYFECDFQSYQDNGSSVANTEAWIATLFNEVQTLYANEQIETSISDILVWNTADPYVGISSTLTILQNFRAARNASGFDGRLAHFVSTRNIGGGIAYVNVLCSNSYQYAVSMGLSTNIQPFPNYSWNIEVVTHEMGHNVASPHTHACAWNGNNTQIDDCGATYQNPQPECYDSGNPIIPNAGTIMSYCHLGTSNGNPGISFQEGFGPQPGDLIRDRYNNANCNTGTCSAPDCSALTAPAPGSSDVVITSDINWENIPGANGYRLTIGTSPTNGSIVNNEDVGLVTTYDPGNLPYGSTIYVQVVPYNDLGNAAGCLNSTFTTEANLPPSCITLTSPSNGSQDVGIDVVLTWPDAPGNQNGYKIRLGTSSGQGDIVNDQDVGNVNSFQPGNLPIETTIYVKIIPYGAAGDLSTCPVTSFTTNDQLAYCGSQGNNASFEWIETFELGSYTNNSGGNGGYEEFTNEVIPISKGQSYATTITPGFSQQSYNEAYKVWIDFNRDGDFSDAGENVFTASLTSDPVSGNISIPTSASSGTTRMRVSMKYNATPTSCESFQFGEVEDYLIEIGEEDNCDMVMNTNAAGSGSLLEAIGCIAPGDTIHFDAALDGSTINLTGAFLDIDGDMIIFADPALDITINASSVTRAIRVNAGSEVEISGVTISGGSTNVGSCILNNGTLTLTDVVMRRKNLNDASERPLENRGEMTLKGSVIFEN